MAAELGPALRKLFERPDQGVHSNQIVERLAAHGLSVSWLGLCGSKETSGGRAVKQGTKKVRNRAAAAFRMAASTLLNSDAPKAITAMAHKLARLFYRLLRYGQQYVDKGAHFYQERWRQQQIAYLHRKSAQLGYLLTPVSP
jgi:transposase